MQRFICKRCEAFCILCAILGFVCKVLKQCQEALSERQIWKTNKWCVLRLELTFAHEALVLIPKLFFPGYFLRKWNLTTMSSAAQMEGVYGDYVRWCIPTCAINRNSVWNSKCCNFAMQLNAYEHMHAFMNIVVSCISKYVNISLNGGYMRLMGMCKHTRLALVLF